MLLLLFFSSDDSSRAEMDDEAAYADDFRSSLTDLTSNSKPHISMLTELAEENSRFSEKIVQVRLLKYI